MLICQTTGTFIVMLHKAVACCSYTYWPGWKHIVEHQVTLPVLWIWRVITYIEQKRVKLFAQDEHCRYHSYTWTTYLSYSNTYGNIVSSALSCYIALLTV